MATGSMLRNRALALATVGAFLGLSRWLAPAPAEPAVWLTLIVLSLGYGHVIGAAAFARSRRSRTAPPWPTRVLAAAVVGSSLLTLFAAYCWALSSPARQPVVLTPILLLFAWHIAENDVELGRAYRNGMRFGPVGRSLRSHAAALMLAAGAGAVAFSTPEGAVFASAYFGLRRVPAQSWLTLDELTAAFVLYHTVSWLLYLEERVRILRQVSVAEAVRLRRRVLAFHLVPLALAAALCLWLPTAQSYLAAPAFYLFWSVLHTLHTAVVRGLEPRSVRA